MALALQLSYSSWTACGPLWVRSAAVGSAAVGVELMSVQRPLPSVEPKARPSLSRWFRVLTVSTVAALTHSRLTSSLRAPTWAVRA